jgi:hypothetical protein
VEEGMSDCQSCAALRQQVADAETRAVVMEQGRASMFDALLSLRQQVAALRDKWRAEAFSMEMSANELDTLLAPVAASEDAKPTRRCATCDVAGLVCDLAPVDETPT